jgi:replication initiation protein RepC
MILPTITTPFGRGRYDSSRFSTQLTARAALFNEDEGAGLRGDQPTGVHKWRLLRQLTEGRQRLGVSERALTVLSALLSFHPETVLSLPQAAQDGAGTPDRARALALIVFPSNRELSLRALGLCERSLARHLSCLVDAGLIIRCDSPNGKRYARKGASGAVEAAYGFDLTPLVLRAAEIEDAADGERRQAAEARALRERCTLARRSSLTLLALAEAEGAFGPFADYARLLAGLAPPRRRADVAVLAERAAALESLSGEIARALELALDMRPRATESTKESGTASQADAHQQSSNIDDFDLELASEEARLRVRAEPRRAVSGEAMAGAVAAETKSAAGAAPPPGSSRPPSLGLAREACPALAQWAGETPRDWPAFVRAAHVARAALGISPDGWTEAVAAMGEQGAAVTVAAILERVEQAQAAEGRAGAGDGTGRGPAGEDPSDKRPPALIRSPGGYLRSLSAKARAGAFRPEPFLLALMATGRAKQAARPALAAV